MANSDRINGNGILRSQWRELARLVLESFAAGIVVSLALALAVFIVTTPAHAAGGDTVQGTLYLKEDSGGKVALPLLFTDVHMDVSGMIARVTVKQRFVNPSSAWREGVYAFPLPENAAVDHLQMHVGERVIEGLIKEREEARRTYETARTEGRKTTLVEQERPNMFTTSVANIGPNEEIVVAIEYQQTLRYDQGSFRLRFPLAITPRYVPGAPLPASAPGVGWSPVTQQVLDAGRITPPLADPQDGYVNPVQIAIDLHAGFPLSRLSSTYHPMRIEEQPGNRFRLTLANGPVPAARDFELVWTPDVGAAPGAALFTETKGGKTYALLMALPPSAPRSGAPRQPREVTYIIDTSGSMEGVSIVQAREALLLALARLQPGDRFNVIEFNSVTVPLFPTPVALDTATLLRAKEFVGGLRARGGTEMLPALQIALAGERTSPMLRQVVFLTDGAVGNEDAILRLISDTVGDRRLFTVGIGPAPNMFFMTKAAQFGRGTFTSIGDVREVKEKMTALFTKLESAALTDIAVAWPAGADAWPRIVPDLYDGEPVVVTRAIQHECGNGQHCAVGASCRHGVGNAPALRASRQRTGRGGALGTGEDRRTDGRRPQGRPGRGNPQRGAGRRAHAPSDKQVHESGGRRRDADPTRRERGVQNRATRQHSRGPDRLRPAAAHGNPRAAATPCRCAGNRVGGNPRAVAAAYARGTRRVHCIGGACRRRNRRGRRRASYQETGTQRTVAARPLRWRRRRARRGAGGRARHGLVRAGQGRGGIVHAQDPGCGRRPPPLPARTRDGNARQCFDAAVRTRAALLPEPAAHRVARRPPDRGAAAPPRAGAGERPPVCADAGRDAVHVDGQQRQQRPRGGRTT